MTITKRIIQYAELQRGPFKRKDLAAWLSHTEPASCSSLQKQLERLVIAEQLSKNGWGTYEINNTVKPRYSITPKSETKEVGEYLRQRYPLADFCIWDASCVIPFMLHIPNIRMIVVDVERLLEQSFPDALREKYPNMLILPSPTKEEFFKFGSTTDCIVLHRLTTESPIEIVDGVPVPLAEKMLVDIVLNPEFDFLYGSELNHIYNEAFSNYNISARRMLRYARRRGCSDKIRNLINHVNSTNND